MPTISNKDNKSTTSVNNLNNVAPPPKADGKVRTNLYATANITQKGNLNALNNYGSPYETDMPESKNANIETPKPNMYRCSVCGVVHEGNDTPKNCLKCDNDRFYKVK